MVCRLDFRLFMRREPYCCWKLTFFTFSLCRTRTACCTCARQHPFIVKTEAIRLSITCPNRADFTLYNKNSQIAYPPPQAIVLFVLHKCRSNLHVLHRNLSRLAFRTMIAKPTGSHKRTVLQFHDNKQQKRVTAMPDRQNTILPTANGILAQRQKQCCANAVKTHGRAELGI